MEKHPKKSTAPGRDLISNLPDEIIQSIVCRISCHKQAAQTSALSRRWRDLWCSHAFVKFDSTRGFQEFADSTMKRFSRDKLLRMQTLDISVEPDNDTIRFPPMEKLLDLASKRKAEYVSINIRRDRMRRNLIRLPYELLSNSSAKTLYLRNIRFESNKNGNDLLVRMNSLRSLEMENVAFQEERLFTNLIASSPNLETLELRGIPGMKKFRLSNIPNLKKFSISDLDDVEEIEISASGLLTLYFMCTRVFRIELIAPQLITLEIEHCGLLRLGDVSRVISKLPNLKSLTLYGFSSLAEQKLNLLNPKLEVFELCPPPGLEEIELDVGPNFSKFVLHWNHSSSLDELKKCEIRNAATHCTWEVHVFKPQISQTLQWFAQLKMFIARFPQFHTINIFVAEVIFEHKEVDYSLHPVDIEHLKLILQSGDEKAFLNHLFWACQPRLLTVSRNHFYPTSLLKFFLDLVSHYSHKRVTGQRRMEFNHHYWLHDLKDVKIKSRDGEQMLSIEEEVKTILERMTTSPPSEVCFELTWH